MREKATVQIKRYSRIGVWAFAVVRIMSTDAVAHAQQDAFSATPEFGSPADSSSKFVESKGATSGSEWPVATVPGRTRRRWYGWQTLAVDGVSGAVLAAGAAADSPVAFGGAFTLVFGAPVVHLVHGHGGKGLASFGMRVVSPVLFGWWLSTCLHKTGESTYSQCDDGALVLAVSSTVIAVTLDAALIASEDVPVSQPTVSFVPTIDPRSRRAAVNVVGVF